MKYVIKINLNIKIMRILLWCILYITIIFSTLTVQLNCQYIYVCIIYIVYI